MDMIFSERNIGLFVLGIFFVGFAFYATHKANQQARKKSETAHPH